MLGNDDYCVSIVKDCLSCDNHNSVLFGFHLNNNNSGFNVIRINICSYKKIIDELLIFLETVKVTLKCIVLTEAQLNNTSDFMRISGYKVFRSYNLEKNDKNGGH